MSTDLVLPLPFLVQEHRAEQARWEHAKKTRWFPGDIKPVHVGVYQNNRGWFKLWDGECWGFAHYSPKAAERGGTYRWAVQNPTWRGLAKKQ